MPDPSDRLSACLPPPQKHEPGTLGYEVLLSDRNPDEVMLLERYASKQYMNLPHKISSPFLAFKVRQSHPNATTRA